MSNHHEHNKDTSSSVESDSASSAMEDDYLDSTVADDELLSHKNEKPRKTPPVPVWINCGRTFVFMGIFLVGVIASAITFVSLHKAAYDTYQATVSAYEMSAWSFWIETVNSHTVRTLLTSLVVRRCRRDASALDRVDLDDALSQCRHSSRELGPHW
jgi:hypothetical protein